MGVLTFDLSLCVGETRTVHFNFESGSKSLAPDTEFLGKVRVEPADQGMCI